MKIKTSELIGPALDWAVAKCEKNTPIYTKIDKNFKSRTSGIYLGGYQYSTNWEQGGPIIERERIQFRSEQHIQYRAFMGLYGAEGIGETHLISAMRCFVTSKLGDEVEIPDELK